MIRSFMRLLLLLLLPLLYSGCATAQKLKPSDVGIKSSKALNLYELGLQQEQWRDYKKAAGFFEEAVLIEPGFGKAMFHAGGCYYSLKKYDEAYKWLMKALDSYGSLPVDNILYLYLGESAFALNHFEEAVAHLSTFVKSPGTAKPEWIATAQRHLKNAEFGITAMKNPVPYKPENLGPEVNTQFDEYLPYLTADGQTLFFTGRRPECIGGFNPEFQTYGEDFFFLNRKDGQWKNIQNLGPPVNTDLNEGASCFSPDGQWVYFTACNRSEGFGSCDIYVAKLNGTTWSKPTNLGSNINSDAWESQPCISSDGKTLFFCSSKKGGKGGIDIWYSENINGKWTTAKPIAGPINTPGNEYAPFLHADDHTLYFASDEHPGMGGQDLFISRLDETGNWESPVNLGYPINSSADETNIFITTEGTTAYVNYIGRIDGLGSYDLYSFEMPKQFRPAFTTYVRGFVTDSSNDKPLSANIQFVDIESGDTVRMVTSNIANGRYLLNLPVGRDYAAFVDAKGFLFASRSFSLKNLGKQAYFDLDIRLQPIQVGQSIVLNNIFYETGKFNLLPSSEAELHHLVTFLKQNSKIKVEIGSHTDNVGTDQSNLLLSQNRCDEVRKYLISKGIDPTRISAMGYGETKPVASNDTEVGRSKNRRTEFKIVGL